MCVHVEAPDEASHEGKADEKVKALEQIDQHIVGPLLEALPQYGDWRILVSPDHRTHAADAPTPTGRCRSRSAGTGIAAARADDAMTRRSRRRKASLAFEKGHELMRWWLGL